MTKHSATKPISQALDELMLGRGVEIRNEQIPAKP